MFVSRPESTCKSRSARGRRRAAAIVEFAMVVPLLALMLNGITEVGRAIMVRQFLNDAVRKACRTGVLPNRANSDITKDINDILKDNSIDTSIATITILVNGNAVDASTAKKNDQISVKVSVPFANVSWTPAFFLGSSAVESETLSMMRQG